MKNTKTKMLAGIVAGAMLMVGGLGCYSAQAQEGTEGNSARQERQSPPRGERPPMMMDNNAAAKHIAESFGVAESDVLNALEQGADVREVGHAAMLAKISGKSLSDVLSLKTQDNSWRDVEEGLGIDQAQIRQEMDGLVAARIAARGNVDQNTAIGLLKDGYRPQDIEMAGILAKESGKDIKAVLDKKKINNRWTDVAKELGVDENKLPRGFGHKGEQGDHFEDHGEPPHGQGHGHRGER
ncbi:MAG: Tat pathway signal sequence domain protein [Selenomonadaceae bacterium]|nr:Tat pathway signal sequence domain protein [Selenomonadaceae bacterium]